MAAQEAVRPEPAPTTAGTILIQIRSRWEPAIELAAQVRHAVVAVAPLHRIDVIVVDIEDPPPIRISR
ncbi:hypothetical protein AB0368_35810 [Actinoplanes sp. NPDC051475]|uniref:hypothetical protein n=1 Tax=Actinoplanes sp. NPDC051475 TaxID=3157225 RepID=UPI00344B7802